MAPTTTMTSCVTVYHDSDAGEIRIEWENGFEFSLTIASTLALALREQGYALNVPEVSGASDNVLITFGLRPRRQPFRDTPEAIAQTTRDITALAESMLP